jgi:RNA polymerase sigma-70 factor (ECF subfamily)
MSSRTVSSSRDCSRDDADFQELYRRYHRLVRDYCRRRVAADVVDDAVAEVFLTAWRRLPDVPEGDAARIWLYGVAYRVVGHEWRSTSRRRRLERRLQSVVGRPVAPVDESVVDADAYRLVLDAVACLGETDAEVLRLVAWEQLSVVEIADVLDLAPNAVTQRLYRARKNLGREYRRLQSHPAPSPTAPKGDVR